MRSLTLVAVLILLLVSTTGTATSAHAADCEFVLGFKALHDIIPTCSITYVTPNGLVSLAAGLVDKRAAADDRVSWKWHIGTGEYSGMRAEKGTVTVTCDGVSATMGIVIG